MTIENLKDNRPDFDELVRRTEESGYRFSYLTLSCEDHCLPIDVEWNYKDLAHVAHVHSHMTRHFFFTGENIYTTIDLQKLFGVTIPQSVVSYSTEDNRIIHQTTLFLFVIYVEIRYDSVGHMRTETTTRYAVGYRSRILRPFLPLIQYAIRRNWTKFTADDRAIRKRRGELRENGFSIDDQSPVDCRATLNITQVGVTPPTELPAARTYEFDVEQHISAVKFIGSTDHLGLQIIFDSDKIRIFPRLCSHRGAVLDVGQTLDMIRCPWHGRQIYPLIEIDRSEEPRQFEGPLHLGTYDGKKLVIQTKTKTTSKKPFNWMSKWEYLKS